MATFPDIVSTRRDVDSPLEQQLFDDLYNRDEALSEHPFFLESAEVSTSATTFTTVKSWQVYVPAGAKKLVIAFQAKVSAGTGSYQVIIGALTSDTKTTTSASYVDTLRCTLSDVSTVRGTEVTVSLQAKNSSGANTTFAKQTDGAACRFLAAT